ncbi:unnamed protein product [Caenorhabditis auriculariae]|uniref:Mos1 transposase HTH domain-containing protein n=1 Tax=Caenorhabditis auriculariae TaxID=2777116 RepID=A0A8S1HBD3_9PELO|nr:unnamed protein product [Caenorhabditis auriculariae]
MDQGRIRMIVYYELLLDNGTGNATANICRACKEDAVSQQTARRWFNRFESGDTSRLAPAEDHALLLVGRQELLYFELLPQGRTVTASIYTDQLKKLAAAIREKRPRRASVHLLHNSARPHMGKETQQKLATLGWETVVYPPYSSELAPSDYHLLRPLKHRLAGRKFINYDNLKSDFADLIESQPPEFRAKGIGDLPNRCATVVNTCGVKRLHAHGHGDQYIHIRIGVPTHIKKDQKELMLAWAALEKPKSGTIKGLEASTTEKPKKKLESPPEVKKNKEAEKKEEPPMNQNDNEKKQASS